jgi:uncharacterized protein (DUF1697 family)
MIPYIAFLRGINVGNIRIKMTDLKSAFEKMGCSDVKTYLQTGNVVFQSAEALPDIKIMLEQGLSATFDYEAYVLLYPFAVLTGIIDGYPLERVETHHAYVIFIENEAVYAQLATLAAEHTDAREQIIPGPGVLYWQVQRGDSTDTYFSKILAKAKYKSTTTVRNVNTLEKMV